MKRETTIKCVYKTFTILRHVSFQNQTGNRRAKNMYKETVSFSVVDGDGESVFTGGPKVGCTLKFCKTAIDRLVKIEEVEYKGYTIIRTDYFKSYGRCAKVLYSIVSPETGTWMLGDVREFEAKNCINMMIEG